MPFARCAPAFPTPTIRLVGAAAPELNLTKQIRDLGLQNAVTVTRLLPDSHFLNYLATVDICINLRYPTSGETSAAFIRMLEAGKVTIVSRTGSFVEFPDDLCIKVAPPGPDELTMLTNALLDLSMNAERRRRFEAAAVRWIETEHRPEDAAARYRTFLANCRLPPEPVRPSRAGRFCDLLADALTDLGLTSLKRAES